MHPVYFLAAAVIAGASGPALGQGWSGDVNLLLGAKRLDRDDWRPTERHGEFGFQANVQPPGWPVALAADLLGSRRDEPVSRGSFVKQRARTSELDLGARKIWRPGPRTRPYLGGGLALVSGELEFAGPFGSTYDRDASAGLWLGGGVFWTLNSVFNVGLDAKLSSAGVRLFGDRKNAGGLHLGMLMGLHWGG